MTAALELTPDDEIKGTKYIVVRRLSSGGHGTIYLVRNRDLPAEKRFALKILNSSHSANADLSARLLREAHLQACIDHPNVVAVYDAGMTTESPSRAYLLMERLRGENLAVMILNAGPSGLGLASIYGIGIQVCDALECAHERGAIHRDIKPDNIFIHRGLNADADAITKVLDFGVAYFMGMVHRRTGEVAIGTPMYMSPEQLRGERPTPRTDLYALGLVLYEMVTGGKRPFRSNTFAELARAHLDEVPPPPSSKVDLEVPIHLERLIMQMLAKDPNDRPPSARYVGSKLREMKQGAEIAYGRRSIEDINKTEETPLENIMMATRAPETNPTNRDVGEQHHTLPGTPKAKAVVSAQREANTRLDATEPGMDLPPFDGHTLETVPGFDTSPLGALRAPTLDPRMAVTHSLPQEPPMAPARTDTEEFSPMAAWAPPSSVLVREVGDRLVAVGDAIASPIRPAAGARATPSTAGSAGALVLSASSRIPMRAWPVRAFALATGGVLLLVAVFLGARRITQQPTLERQSTANSALPSITLSVASAAPPASTDFSAASPAVAESGAPQLAPSASAASMPPVAPIPPVAAAAPPATMKPPPRYDDFKPSVSLTPASAPSHSARAAVAPSSARPSAPPKPKPRDDGLDLILDKP